MLLGTDTSQSALIQCASQEAQFSSLQSPATTEGKIPAQKSFQVREAEMRMAPQQPVPCHSERSYQRPLWRKRKKTSKKGKKGLQGDPRERLEKMLLLHITSLSQRANLATNRHGENNLIVIIETRKLVRASVGRGMSDQVSTGRQQGAGWPEGGLDSQPVLCTVHL